MTATCQQLISDAVVDLLTRSDSALLDAEVLLSHVLQQSRAWIMAYQDELIEPALARQFRELVAQRRQGKPIAHLIGEREFWSLPIRVSADVLIPRPETELLVEQLLELYPPESTGSIVDLGTGSGAIAIALSYERPHCQLTAVEQSAAALALARRNAATIGTAANITFMAGSWFEPLADQRFDAIVSNPPYIAANDQHLQQGDVRFEPTAALVSGHDGLKDLHHIIEHAPDYLHNNGYLLLEHGYTQGPAVRQLAQRRGFTAVTTLRDLSGQPRATLGQWQGQ